MKNPRLIPLCVLVYLTKYYQGLESTYDDVERALTMYEQGFINDDELNKANELLAKSKKVTRKEAIVLLEEASKLNPLNYVIKEELMLKTTPRNKQAKVYRDLMLELKRHLEYLGFFTVEYKPRFAELEESREYLTIIYHYALLCKTEQRYKQSIKYFRHVLDFDQYDIYFCQEQLYMLMLKLEMYDEVLEQIEINKDYSLVKLVPLLVVYFHKKDADNFIRTAKIILAKSNALYPFLVSDERNDFVVKNRYESDLVRAAILVDQYHDIKTLFPKLIPTISRFKFNHLLDMTKEEKDALLEKYKDGIKSKYYYQKYNLETYNFIHKSNVIKKEIENS